MFPLNTFTAVTRSVFSVFDYQAWGKYVPTAVGPSDGERLSCLGSDTPFAIEMGPIDPLGQAPVEEETMDTPADIPDSGPRHDDSHIEHTVEPAASSSTFIVHDPELLAAGHASKVGRWWDAIKDVTAQISLFVGLLAFSATIVFGVATWKFNHWAAETSSVHHSVDLCADNSTLPQC